VSCCARRSASSSITPGRILRFVVAVAEDRCPPSARAGHAARRRSTAAALPRPVTPAAGQQERRPRRDNHAVAQWWPTGCGWGGPRPGARAVAARALPGDIQLRRIDDARGWRVFRIRFHREPPIVIGSGHRGYNRALAAHQPRRAGRLPRHRCGHSSWPATGGSRSSQGLRGRQHLQVRDASYTDRPFYVVIGVRVDGHRDMLSVRAGDVPVAANSRVVASPADLLARRPGRADLGGLAPWRAGAV
jgi:hypothetical protein